MLDVKWIKLTTDVFDNEKIKLIEKMPDGDTLVICWFKLLVLAGKTNDCGNVYFTQDIPYTEEMLAVQFGRPLPTVRLALNTFQRFRMIEVVDDIIHVSNWEKYQNVDGLEKLREQNRKRAAAFRERQKAKMLADNVTRNVTNNAGITQNNAIEEDKEKEKEEDKEKGASAREVVALYNEICTSFPKVRSLSEARKKAVRARLRTYTLEDFKSLFEKAEASDFLRGKNGRNWTATFDWLICDANMAKVLDGNYDQREEPAPKQAGKYSGLNYGALLEVRRD